MDKPVNKPCISKCKKIWKRVYDECIFDLQLHEFWKQNECKGETEARQKVEVTPESIGLGNMQAQAGIGTKSDAFVFYRTPRLFLSI